MRYNHTNGVRYRDCKGYINVASELPAVIAADVSSAAHVVIDTYPFVWKLMTIFGDYIITLRNLSSFWI